MKVTSDKLRIRNQGIRHVRVADLEDAPWNFRTHPDSQRQAFGGTVEEIGWYGYPDVYETDEGILRICDGHLRKSFLLERYGADAEIEVNVTDFNEREARLATVTHDPLAAMATADGPALAELLRGVATGSEALQQMLDDLAQEHKIVPPAPPDEFPEVGEDIEVENVCPKCGYRFSGGKTVEVGADGDVADV
jgi:hypothetical protein